MTEWRTAAAAPATAERDDIQHIIAAQLALAHGRATTRTDEQGTWIYIPGDELRAAYFADADALIDQGLTPYWQPPRIPARPSPALEAEIFEFERAMAWFMEYLDERHPGWRESGHPPASHIEEADPLDWDAWVSVAVTASEVVRQLWSQRLTEITNVARPIETTRTPLPPPAVSAPPAAHGGVLRDRIITAAAATLAHRHGRRWIDLPTDLRAAYISDVEALMALGLIVGGP